jgi:predicted extracellular nuclease
MRVLLAAIAAILAFAAPASAQSPDLVVSQVYGGGGNTAASFTHDFIEIFNRSGADVPLGGKSLQYASATGTGNFGANTTQLTELPSVTLAAGQYFLVQEASGGANGAALSPDFTDPTPINLAAGAGKVAIVTGTDTLGCNGGSATCTPAQLARIIDLVGYGGANFFEGLGPAPGAGNGSSVSRNDGGCTDTDNNVADFTATVPPAPRNTSTTRNPCDAPPGDDAPTVTDTEPDNGETQVPLDASVEITFSEDVTLAGDAVSIQCTQSGAHPATRSGGPRTYTFDPTGNFVRNETCTVRVSATGVSDQDASDPPDTMAADHTFSFSTTGLALRIHDIQAAQHLSPYDDDFVAGVPGVVTALASNGFWLQDPQPDDDERTSEGIFVFTGAAPAVTIGQPLAVNGQVQEFRAGGDIPSNDNLTITEIVGPTWAPAGTGTITPTTVGFGGRIPPIFVIDNDAVGGTPENEATPFDPRQDGIDFHESLEGMLVRVNNPVAVGPTNNFAELPVVGDRGFLAFPRTSRGGVLVRPFDFNPERLILDDGAGFRPPDADVRDRLDTVHAVVDYSFGNFKYKLTSATEAHDGGLQREVTEAPRQNELATASMNVENLDPFDPPEKFEELASILVTNMRSPDLVAVEEVQDNDGARSPAPTDATLTYQRFIAAIQAAGGPRYEFRQIDPASNQDGGEPNGNIRVGFLFRSDRGLSFVDRPGGTAVNGTQVVDAPDGPQLSLSPGRIDPTNPAFANSRKPLAGEFRWKGRTLFAIANHFNSKGGDDPLFGRVQPPVRSTEVQRHQQAHVVADFVEQLLDADRRANVVVLGDLNDFEFSETLDILEDSGLTNLMETLPVPERYSYVFEGNSQTLDQILVSDALTRPRPEYDSVHVNAEFFDQASDHDPQVARLRVTGRGGGDGDHHGDDD